MLLEIVISRLLHQRVPIAVSFHLILFPPSIPPFPFSFPPSFRTSHLSLRPPSVSASYSIYFSIHSSCGYSTQLCSRQTIWCTLLMTDPTWHRRRLAATTRCVFVCVSVRACVCEREREQVHADWWCDVVCSFNHRSRCTGCSAPNVLLWLPLSLLTILSRTNIQFKQLND